MKTTLEDIAKATGYSISTVSRVLNGLDGTSTNAREQILRSAHKLNYPVWNVGNDVITDPVDVLLVIGFEVGEFYASFFDGFNQAAANGKVRLNLTSLEKTGSKPETILSRSL